MQLIKIGGLSLLLVGLGMTSCKQAGPTEPESVVQSAGNGSAAKPTWLQRMGLSVKKGSDGLKVTDVEKVSPACVMGLQRNDVIVALNGMSVQSPTAFQQAAQKNIDSSFRPWCFTVKRGGQDRKLPQNCNFRKLKRDKKSGFDCDPVNMRVCGPLTWQCQDKPGTSGT